MALRTVCIVNKDFLVHFFNPRARQREIWRLALLLRRCVRFKFSVIIPLATISQFSFLISHSPFPIPHSPFPIPHSPFPIPHSPFPIPRFSNIHTNRKQNQLLKLGFAQTVVLKIRKSDGFRGCLPFTPKIRPIYYNCRPTDFSE